MTSHLLLAAAAVSIAAASSAIGAPKGALIPRDVLFGNPDRAGVQISPDGSKISFLAPVDGVLNVWVGPASEPAKARPVTDDRSRGIRNYNWAFTSGHIAYLQDTGGDEDWKLYITDLTTGETRNLTPIDEIPGPDGKPMMGPDGKQLRPTARFQQTSRKFPDEMLIGLNDRDPRYHDIYRYNIATGRRELVQKNEGMRGFVTDNDFRVRLAMRSRTDGGNDVLRPDGDGGWADWFTIGLDDSLTTSPAGFDHEGNTLYMLDRRGRDTGALVAMDVSGGFETAKAQVIASDARADISGAFGDPRTGRPLAASSTYMRQEWKVIDPSIEADFAKLRTVADGDFSISSATLDNRKWIVAYVMDNGPVRYYLYDRDDRSATFLFTNRKALESVTLSKMHPVVIKSRDGLDLVSYLTLPNWTDSDNDARPDAPLPMVLLVHGGPWARDNWGLNGTHQWLANRGYAVLSVNFRGSTGFGKKFLNAGNMEWAKKMHDDLLDAVDWAVAQKIADPAKVALMGGSYGGYATLTGVTFTPDKFACGVSIVGPSNLITLLDSIPPYWTSFRDQFRQRVGDIDSDEGRALLEERSPLSRVDRIRKPLLIGQGANDPRVKQAESDQIVTAMKKKNIPVTYVLFPDEGHGFARPQNRMSFNAVTEAYLAEHLGGQYEPIGRDFEGSSITVPQGADGVPGLEDAMSR